MKEVPKLSDFPVGKPNDAYAKYFIGQSWLAPLTTEQVPTYNVTFEPWLSIMMEISKTR